MATTKGERTLDPTHKFTHTHTCTRSLPCYTLFYTLVLMPMQKKCSSNLHFCAFGFISLCFVSARCLLLFYIYMYSIFIAFRFISFFFSYHFPACRMGAREQMSGLFAMCIECGVYSRCIVIQLHNMIIFILLVCARSAHIVCELTKAVCRMTKATTTLYLKIGESLQHTWHTHTHKLREREILHNNEIRLRAS